MAGTPAAQSVSPFHIEEETLVVDDLTALNELRSRTHWSPSSSNSVKSCPARWVTEKLLPRPDDPFGAREIGTSMHAVLEVFFGLPAAQRTRKKAAELVDQLPSMNMKDVVVPADPADLMRWKAEVVKLVLGIFTLPDVDVTKVHVLGLERKLDTTHIGGVPFNGRIDMTDLLRAGDGSPAGTRVVDFKSTAKGMKSAYQRKQFGDSHGDQGLQYHIALNNLDGAQPDAVEIWYLATGEIHQVQADPRSLARVEKDFVESFTVAMESAKTGRYEMRAGNLCGYCPLATVCLAARAKGKGKVAKNGPEQIADKMPIKVIEGGTDVPATTLAGSPDGASKPILTTNGTNRKGDAMGKTLFADETGSLKAWNETGGDTSKLSGLSYAAIAVFGLMSDATKILSRFDAEHGTSYSRRKANVTAMAKTMLHVVATVQQELGGSDSLMDGLNTRLRGAMFTAIETLPSPIGGNRDDWAKWVQLVIRRTRGIAEGAVDLWAQGPGVEPWNVLADAAAVDTAASVAEPERIAS